LENPSGLAPAIAVKRVSRHSVIASGTAGPAEGVRLKRELPSRINILFGAACLEGEPKVKWPLLEFFVSKTVKI